MTSSATHRRFRRVPGNEARGSLSGALILVLLAAFGTAIVLGETARRVTPLKRHESDAQHEAQSSLPWIRGAAVMCVGLVFFVAYWVSFPRDLQERPVFNSPRESIGYYLTERFIDGHGFSAPLQHFDDLPRDIGLALTPRDAANLNGAVVPKDFAGTMLLYAGVMRVHPALALAISPLFAVMGAWALMRIARELFGWEAGFVALCCWMAFPPLWISASYIFMGDLPALAFLLLAVLVFVQYWREPTESRVVLMSALFCASVLFRYPNVLIALPFPIAIMLGRRLVFSHAVIAVGTAVPFMLVLLAFNQLVYGAPLTTGFHLGTELIGETVNYSGESFLRRRPDVLWRYIRMYTTLPLISLPIGLGLVGALLVAVRARGTEQVLAVVALATFVILLVYYGQQDAWGYSSPKLNASFLRYMLPGFALMSVFGAWLISSAARRWGAGIYVIPITFILAAALYVRSDVGEVYSVVDRSTTLEQQVVASTEPHSVIAVRIMDKVIFPERQTLTLTYALHNDSPVSKEGLETWDHVAPPERFAEVALTMNSKGIPVYLLPDARLGNLAAYQAALQEHGYYLRRIKDVEIAALFKVSRDRTQ